MAKTFYSAVQLPYLLGILLHYMWLLYVSVYFFVMLWYMHARSMRNCQLAHSANITHVLAVNLDQLGTPTWFFTLSAADVKWPDVMQTRAKQWDVLYTDDEVRVLSFII